MNRRFLAALAFVLAFALQGWAQGNATAIRVGAFPNITHAQPMVGKAGGWFEKALGSAVKTPCTSFSARPTALEALLAGCFDMAYIRPYPAVAGYGSSNGEVWRGIAGAARGGAFLLVRTDSGIQKPEDFHGM